jgi:hypothetical protein
VSSRPSTACSWRTGRTPRRSRRRLQTVSSVRRAPGIRVPKEVSQAFFGGLGESRSSTSDTRIECQTSQAVR